MFSAEYDRQWRPHAISPGGAIPDEWSWWEGPSHGPSCYHTQRIRIAVGDRLWVKEAARRNPDLWHYSADDTLVGWPGRQQLAHFKRDTCSPRFMPKAASRITLIVERVKVERLQDISGADAVAEGAPLDPGHHDTTQDSSNPHMVAVNAWTKISPVAWYHRLWDEIHGPEAWDTNPWVAVFTFKTILQNIQKVAA
jgi:hypothetical protein